MSIEFKLPAVGENVETAEIGSLRVAEGDVISADQVVMEIETDKAVFELPCPQAGKITKIHVKPGDTVKAGAMLLSIDESSAGDADKGEPQAKAAKGDKPESESKAGKGQAPTPDAAPAEKPAPDAAKTSVPKTPAKSPEKPASPASPAAKRPAAATAVAKSAEPAVAAPASKP